MKNQHYRQVKRKVFAAHPENRWGWRDDFTPKGFLICFSCYERFYLYL